MRKTISVSIWALSLCGVAHSEPELHDVILDCKLSSITIWKDGNISSYPYSREEIIKFDPRTKSVTYLFGPGVTIEALEQFDSENRIYFYGESIHFGNYYRKYSGSVDRNTGQINYEDLEFRDGSWDHNVDTFVGICQTGHQKF